MYTVQATLRLDLHTIKQTAALGFGLLPNALLNKIGSGGNEHPRLKRGAGPMAKKKKKKTQREEPGGNHILLQTQVLLLLTSIFSLSRRLILLAAKDSKPR